MTTATALFHSIRVISRSDEPGDDRLVASLSFTLRVGTQEFPGLKVDIRGTLGSRAEDSLLEVSQPFGYEGRFNHTAFQQCVAQYCREIFKRPAVQSSNAVLAVEARYEFDVGAASAGW